MAYPPPPGGYPPYGAPPRTPHHDRLTNHLLTESQILLNQAITNPRQDLIQGLTATLLILNSKVMDPLLFHHYNSHNKAIRPTNPDTTNPRPKGFLHKAHTVHQILAICLHNTVMAPHPRHPTRRNKGTDSNQATALPYPKAHTALHPSSKPTSPQHHPHPATSPTKSPQATPAATPTRSAKR